MAVWSIHSFIFTCSFGAVTASVLGTTAAAAAALSELVKNEKIPLTSFELVSWAVIKAEVRLNRLFSPGTNWNSGSISSTFYKQLLRMHADPKSAKKGSQVFSFLRFWCLLTMMWSSGPFFESHINWFQQILLIIIHFNVYSFWRVPSISFQIIFHYICENSISKDSLNQTRTSQFQNPLVCKTHTCLHINWNNIPFSFCHSLR